jgi:hypothetical protein
MEDAMSIGEAVVVALIIFAFVTFAATLAWAAHADHPRRSRAHRPVREVFESMLHFSHR